MLLAKREHGAARAVSLMCCSVRINDNQVFVVTCRHVTSAVRLDTAAHNFSSVFTLLPQYITTACDLIQPAAKDK
jgi:hypothetical protein